MSSQLITGFKNEVTLTFIINFWVISFNFRPKNEPFYRDLFAHKAFHHNISHDQQKKAKYNVWQSNSIGFPKVNVFSNINIWPCSVRQFARAGARTVTPIKLQVVIIRVHFNCLYFSCTQGLFLNDSQIQSPWQGIILTFCSCLFLEHTIFFYLFHIICD